MSGENGLGPMQGGRGGEKKGKSTVHSQPKKGGYPEIETSHEKNSGKTQQRGVKEKVKKTGEEGLSLP